MEVAVLVAPVRIAKKEGVRTDFVEAHTLVGSADGVDSVDVAEFVGVVESVAENKDTAVVVVKEDMGNHSTWALMVYEEVEEGPEEAPDSYN